VVYDGKAGLDGGFVMPHLDIVQMSDALDLLIPAVATLTEEQAKMKLQLTAAAEALSTLTARYNLLQEQIDGHQHEHATQAERPSADILSIVKRLERIERQRDLPPIEEQ
jgi:hypothetical protein